jgi:hypothetical protein
MGADPIALYGAKAPAAFAAICGLLRMEISRALPKSPARLYYAMPVWFVGANPVVGYKIAAKHVNLLFWNGQAFGEAGLRAAGKFKAAQVQFTDAAQVDRAALRRWLKLAGTKVWSGPDVKAKRKAAR